jgi:hypothetical protein
MAPGEATRRGFSCFLLAWGLPVFPYSLVAPVCKSFLLERHPGQK